MSLSNSTKTLAVILNRLSDETTKSLERAMPNWDGQKNCHELVRMGASYVYLELLLILE
jgi:hypothetical protein